MSRMWYLLCSFPSVNFDIIIIIWYF
jgi:hypothetical protein